MKFFYDSKKLNMSFIILINMLFAFIYCSSINNNKNANDEESSYLQITESSFLALEEAKKEMSKDMQYENLFVTFKS